MLSEKVRVKIIIAGIVGNILEWYDFALFGILASFLAHNFFPTTDERAGLIGSLSILAVGYFARPLGGLLMGHVGDKHSRRTALILGLVLMGLATTCIGLLPTYASIGISATILLVILRIIQGLAVGGEFPGSFVILVEQANPRWKSLTASFTLVGAGLGVLAGTWIASFLAQHLSQAQLLSWGWRAPFLLGIILTGVGLYIRLKVWKKNQAVQLEAENITIKFPVVKLFKNHKKALAKCACLLLSSAVMTGMIPVFLVTYLTHYLNFSLVFALKLLSMTMVLMIVLFPASSLIADYFKIHRAWLLCSSLLLIIIVYPLFILMQQGQGSCWLAVFLLCSIFYAGCGPFIPMMTKLFPEHVRYSGVGVAHGAVYSIVAGTAPLVLNGLVLWLGVLGPSFYIMIGSAAMFLVVRLSKELK